MLSNRCYSLKVRVAVLSPLLAGVIVAQTVGGDDRDLLRESSADPYVFILFDTSGSMNWSTRCTAEQLAAGDCRQLCTTGDCFTKLNSDDPASKFYQAKEALYEVLNNTANLQLGFATFNQDDLRAQGKHWLYRMQAGEHPTHLVGGQHFPLEGSEQVFGRTFNCDSGGSSRGFTSGSPARLTNAWELARLGRCPQLGQAGTTTGAAGQDFYFVDSNNVKYRLRWSSKGGETLGAPVFTATAQLWRCNVSNCSTLTSLQTTDITYDLVDEFVAWDNGADDTPPQNGYFSQSQSTDATTEDGDQANDSCLGWDPNDDTNVDTFANNNLRWPTVLHPTASYRPWMNEGDVIPLDWTDNNRDVILDRLAPNRVLGEGTPDFSSSRYLQDQHNSSNLLELKDSRARPIFANGSTPLGFAIADFRTWWAGCEQGSCPNNIGWKNLATAHDPDWACRKKYLLVITDGDDTCPGRDPCSFTAALRAQENILTYVVAFGVQNTAQNKLTCMASNGGTGNPIYPQNRRELVEALSAIFGEIAEESRSFASAAVPSVQAEVDDKLFLSSFTPLNATAYWDGHLDAFLKPLPLTDARLPDKSKKCSSLPPDRQASCHLWDAGETLLSQSPTEQDFDSGQDFLGTSEGERRVFYPLATDPITEAVPSGRSFLRQPNTPQARRDLWDGLGLDYDVSDLVDDDSDPAERAAAIIRRTLVKKNETVTNADGTTTPITYLLGDIFHSNPTVIDRPDDFSEFAANRYSDESDADGQTCTDSSPGYRCFARKHERRRKMLAVGANDGQLHFFDAGSWNNSTEKFSNGTGKELFSFIPRSVMPILAAQESGNRQIYSLDGSPRAVNVFIDPEHRGGGPRARDRQWRTVMIGGLREGGSVNGGLTVELENRKTVTSGYFALDLTQPDPLNDDNTPSVTGAVPGCLVAYSAGSCGPVEFGSELWAFTDSIDGSPAEWGVGFDEDVNGTHDLGDTWSTPVLGRIRLGDASTGEDRWVAVFGGGFDPNNRNNPRRGNWIYMVDVETGKALYKRQVDGAVPSTPAVVDFNNDGYLDAVYAGTTTGFLYKIDMRAAVVLTTVNVRDVDGASHAVDRITDPAWEPFKIFDTLADGVRRPLFFPPTVLLVAEAGQFALAFGSGDREQLWNLNNVENRFYVIADEGFGLTSTGLPKTEANYTVIDAEATFNPTANFLLRPPGTLNRGFVITLDPNERVVAPAFSISGLTVFPTFNPQVTQLGLGLCARTGDSRVFVILTTSGDPVLPEEFEGSGVERYFEVGDALVTPPYVDQGTTGNAGGSSQDSGDLAWRESILDKLKQLFPPRTKFANYTIEVNFLRSDTGVVRSIPVPIGVVSKNWKQF